MSLLAVRALQCVQSLLLVHLRLSTVLNRDAYVRTALLGVRGKEEHEAAMAQHKITPIDLVVVNLYPFEATVAKVPFEPIGLRMVDLVNREQTIALVWRTSTLVAQP